MASTPPDLIPQPRRADNAEKISYGAIALSTLAVLMSLYSCMEAKKDDPERTTTTRTETYLTPTPTATVRP